MMRLIFFFFFAVSVHAEIFEISTIKQCEEHIRPDRLIVFDIDNTIMEASQTLGSDQWFSYRIRENQNKGLSEQESFYRTLIEWMAVQLQTQVKLVEPQFSSLFDHIVKGGWKVVGLTSRGQELAGRTLEQLNSIGVDLSRASPTPQEIVFGQGQVYHGGVLFAHGSNKSTLLFQFLNRVALHPKGIIFVDDKMNNLLDVEKECAANQIAFWGLRYAYMDKKVQAMRPEVAEVQLKTFSQLISDEEALQRMTVTESGG